MGKKKYVVPLKEAITGVLQAGREHFASLSMKRRVGRRIFRSS